METLYREYKDKVKFYIVYVKEAHPDDGWQLNSNKRAKVIYDTPKTLKERAKIASDCVKDLKMTIPCLIDDMKDTVQKTYKGWPARAFLIGTDGKILFASKGGPRGVTPKEIEKALKEKIPEKQTEKQQEE